MSGIIERLVKRIETLENGLQKDADLSNLRALNKAYCERNYALEHELKALKKRLKDEIHTSNEGKP